jgi:hypothetical protein
MSRFASDGVRTLLVAAIPTREPLSPVGRDGSPSRPGSASPRRPAGAFGERALPSWAGL